MSESENVLSSSTLAADVIVGLLATADIGTDTWVAVSVLVLDDADTNPLFHAGFAFLLVSGVFRLLTECIFYNDLILQKKRKARFHSCVSDSFCYRCEGELYVILVLFWTAVILPILFLYKTVRFLLFPLDPFLALGHKLSKSGTFYFPIIRAPHFHDGMDAYFRQMPFAFQYLSLMSDLVAGGRFKVSYYANIQNIQGHASGSNRFQDDKGKIVVILATLEEVLENIGGILMSLSLLLWDSGDEEDAKSSNNTNFVALGSLVVSIVSAIIETGKYIGDYRELYTEEGKQRRQLRQQATDGTGSKKGGPIHDEEETSNSDRK